MNSNHYFLTLYCDYSNFNHVSSSHDCLLHSSLPRGSCCPTTVTNSPLNSITIPLAPYLIIKVLCIWQWLDDGGGGGSNCVWLTESVRLLWSQSSLETGEHHLLFWLSSEGRVAAAAAKSLQSCPTLCNPIDGIPPGSPVPGILQQEHWSGLPFPSPMHESEVAQPCPTLSDPMDCSLPGSSAHGTFQATVLEWHAIAFSGRKS